MIVIFAKPNGDVIKLKDIADVKLDFSEVPMKNYVNGKRGVSFIVKKTTDEDLDKIDNEVGELIEQSAEEAAAAPVPSPEEVTTDVYVSY